MPSESKSREREKKQEKGPSLLEWAAAFVGFVLAVGMLAFLGVEALQSSAGRPPILEVQPTAVHSRLGIHVLEVEVVNHSAQTAAAVAIKGELRQGGSTAETSTATLSYVPGNSVRQAGLIFSRDPRRYQLQLRATGYEKP